MDNSTNGVTLLALFPIGIMDLYKDKPSIMTELQKIMEGSDLSAPNKLVPMAKYNQMCEWIEKNLGTANIKISGKTVGKSVYDALVQYKMVDDKSTPEDIMKGLVKLSTQVIQDSKNRGWELIEPKENSLVMKRTQTFNSSLQFGVLEGLLYKCKLIYSPKVELIKEVAKGDEFDEFLLTWKPIGSI